MNTSLGLYLLGIIAAIILLHKLRARLLLFRAKHSSLGGHGRIARRVTKMVPYYGYSEEQFFSTDGAPEEVVQRRRGGFDQLAKEFRARSPKSVSLSEQLETNIPDVRIR